MIRRISPSVYSEKEMQQFKETLLILIAQVGIVGTLELISEISRDFGDTSDFDPFWKLIETHCYQTAELAQQQVNKRYK